MASSPGIVGPINRPNIFLMIIQAALAGLSIVPGLGAGVGVAAAFVQIIIHAKQAYEAEVGQPLDLNKIPLETPVV